MNPVSSSPSISLQANQVPTEEPAPFTKNLVSFLGFSQSDQDLLKLIQNHFCDEEGLPVVDHLGQSFDPIEKSHPIHKKVAHLLHQPQESYPADHLITKLVAYSKFIGLRREEKLFLSWPNPITEAHITGSQAWQLLFAHKDLFEQILKKLFGDHFSLEEILRWQENSIAHYQAEQNYHGQETDIRLLCPQADSDHLASFTLLAKKDFQQKVSKGVITQFTVIKDKAALIGFYHEGIHREITIAKTITPLSNQTGLYLSFLDEMRFKVAGFDLLQAIMGACMNVYFFSFNNPQSLVRFLYRSSATAMGRAEEKMVAALLAPFEKAKPNASFLSIMRLLGFEHPLVANLGKKAMGLSTKEKMVVQYICFLAKHKLERKKALDGTPLFPELTTPFLLRWCYMLHRYEKLSDFGIELFLDWFYKEKMLFNPQTPLLARELVALIRQHHLPFSLVCACTTLLAWVYQPHTFTQRQNPAIFAIAEPFHLHLSADLLQAMATLKNSASATLLVDALTLLSPFFQKQFKNQPELQKKICEEQQLSFNSFAPYLDFCLQHDHPFLNLLAIELTLIFGQQGPALYLLESLPQLIEKEFIFALEMLKSTYVEEMPEFDPTSLKNWVEFLITIPKQSYVLKGYQLWKNYLAEEKELGQSVLKALALVEPFLALKLYRTFKAQEKTTPLLEKEILKIFMVNFPSFEANELCSDLYLFFTQQRPLTLHDQKNWLDAFWLYLDQLSDLKNQRLLLLPLVLIHSFPIKEIPEKLAVVLAPLDLLFTYQQRARLPFESILALIAHLTGEFCFETNACWIEGLLLAFYPSLKKPLSYEKTLSNLSHLLFPVVCSVSQRKELKPFEVSWNLLNFTKNFDLPKDLFSDAPALPDQSAAKEESLFKQTSFFLEHADPFMNQLGWQLATFFSLPTFFPSLLLHLPLVLQKPNSFMKRLKELFELLSENKEAASSPLHLLDLNDWILLLARQKEIEFVETAYQLWAEHGAPYQQNLDLKLFQSLCSANSCLALKLFEHLQLTRQKPLSLLQCVTCFCLLLQTKQPITLDHLQQALLAFKQLLTSKKQDAFSFSKPLSLALDLLAKAFPNSLQIQELILDAIFLNAIKPAYLNSHYPLLFDPPAPLSAHSFYHSKELVTAQIKMGISFLAKQDPRALVLLEHLMTKKIAKEQRQLFLRFGQQWLQSLNAEEYICEKTVLLLNFLKDLYAFTPPLELNQLKKDFLTKMAQERSYLKKAASSIIIFSFVYEEAALLVQVPNGIKALFKYLHYLQIENNERELFELFKQLVMMNHVKQSIEFTDLWQLFALLVQKKEYPTLATDIFKLLPPIDQLLFHFKELRQETVVWVYLQIALRYQLDFAEKVSEIWQFLQMITIEEISNKVNLHFLFETKELKNWNYFLTNHLTSEDSLFVYGLLHQAIQEQLSNTSFKQNSCCYDLILLFINAYLKHCPLEKLQPLNIEEEATCTLITALLKKNPSNGIKRYLLLETDKAFVALKTSVEKEIHFQCNQKPLHFSFILLLIQRYFPQDLPPRISLFKLLGQIKNDSFLELAIKDLNTFSSFSLELAQCWLLVLRHLKEKETIWKFIHQLPALFQKQEYAEVKKEAITILIERALKANRAEKEETGIDFISEREEQEKHLLTLFLSFSNPSLPFFIKLFSLFSTKAITSRPKEMLLFVLSFHAKQSSNAQPMTKLPKVFKENYNHFLKAIFFHFQELYEKVLSTFIALDNEQSGQISIDLKSSSSKMVQQIIEANQLVAETNEFLVCTEQCLQFTLKQLKIEPNNTIYDLICLVLRCYYQGHEDNLKDCENLFLSKFAVPYFSFAPILYQIIEPLPSDVASLKEIKQENLRVLCFLILLLKVKSEEASYANKVLSLLLPLNTSLFHPSYFEQILACNYFVYNENDQEQVEKVHSGALLFVSSFIHIMKKKEKEGKSKELLELKVMFEKGIEWLVKKNYELKKAPLNRLHAIRERLSEASSLQCYQSNNPVNWLNIYLNVLKLEIDIPHPHTGLLLKEVMTILLHYHSVISIEHAANLFNSCLIYDKRCVEKTRLELFAMLMDALCDYPTIVLNKQTFFSYLHKERNLAINNPTYAAWFDKGALYYNYSKELAKIEFKATVHCTKQLIQNQATPYLIAHYQKLLLEMHEQSKERGFFENKPLSYLKGLSLLMKGTIQVEKFYHEGQILTNSIEDVPTLGECLEKLVLGLVTFETKESIKLKEKKYQLLTLVVKKFFAKKGCVSFDAYSFFNGAFKLLSLVINHNEILQNDNKREIVSPEKAALIELILNRIESFKIVEEHQIYIKLVRFHYSLAKLSMEEKADEFKKCCDLLKNVPYGSNQWSMFYTFISQSIDTIFAGETSFVPYRLAAVYFLQSHLTYFQSTSSLYEEATIIVCDLFYKLLDIELLALDDPTCLIEFAKFENWFQEKEVNCVALELLKIRLQEPFEEQNKLYQQAKDLMPNYLDFIQQFQKIDKNRQFSSVANAFPEKKQELLFRWALYQAAYSKGEDIILLK